VSRGNVDSSLKTIKMKVDEDLLNLEFGCIGGGPIEYSFLGETQNLNLAHVWRRATHPFFSQCMRYRSHYTRQAGQGATQPRPSDRIYRTYDSRPPKERSAFKKFLRTMWRPYYMMVT
jgi:hypothetical protein